MSMQSFLDPLLKQYGQVPIVVPEGFKQLKEPLAGALYVSRQGYVYSAPSKTVLWLKLAGLALSIPLLGIAKKCVALFKQCFGCAVPQKGFHDLKHVFHLSGIAWKGLLGGCGKPLAERAEEYALAELDYNYSDRGAIFMEHRSMRLEREKYSAICMQPLFHINHCKIASKIRPRIESLEKSIADLKQELQARKNKSDTSLRTSFINFVVGNERPYKTWSLRDINKLLSDSEAELAKLKKQGEISERCHQYAYKAIYSQQCCPKAAQCTEDNFVTTQADVKFCGERCYRQQRICGILYKIDCCFTRCWALDCLCCFCCLWPEGRTWCML